MYVCMYVCMHACMYVCMHVCIYVWSSKTHPSTWQARVHAYTRALRTIRSNYEYTLVQSGLKHLEGSGSTEGPEPFATYSS
jgi:hypothetical protein